MPKWDEFMGEITDRNMSALTHRLLNESVWSSSREEAIRRLQAAAQQLQDYAGDLTPEKWEELSSRLADGEKRITKARGLP